MTISALLLERLTALLQQSVREDAARHGLLPIHLQVLQYLNQANRYSDLPIAVADYFGITRGTVSQTLSVLVRKGLLIKKADPRHGKRVHLKLTVAGRAVLTQSWTGRLEAALHTLPDDAEHLEETLQTLLVALQRQNGQQAFGICRECAHFIHGKEGAQCGLTGEPLAIEQTQRICREWASAGDNAPAAASEETP